MRRGCFVVCLLAVVATLSPARAGAGPGHELMPLDGRVLGLTYRQWDVVWGRTQAVTPVGAPRSLGLTRSGRRCGVQIGRARLLPVSFRGLLTARCTIPAGTFLIFPVTGYVDSGERPQGLLASVRRNFRAIEQARLTVDGRSVQPGHVVTTPAFRVNLPSPNGIGIPPGPEWLLSKDYFAILSPPSLGTHTITTLGVFDPPDQPQFSLGVTYRITVRRAAGAGLTGRPGSAAP